jgi:hypothetical protein
MADLKISALTASTTPLAGTEVLPIVQSSTTKQVSVANLTAGRTVSGLNFISGSDTATFNVVAGASTTGPGVQAYGKTAAAAAGWVVYTSGTADFVGTHAWYKNNFAGTATYLGGWYSNGDYKLDNGNVVIGTSGKGIDFSATAGTGTSELLADYEEGTYTAVLTPQTSGTIPLNSSFDTLAYTKVGRLVTITGQIQTFNPSAPVGAYFTLSLPFTIADLTELAGRGGFILNYQNTAVSANWEEGLAYIYVNKNASTVLTSENLYVSFSYFAA